MAWAEGICLEQEGINSITVNSEWIVTKSKLIKSKFAGGQRVRESQATAKPASGARAPVQGLVLRSSWRIMSIRENPVPNLRLNKALSSDSRHGWLVCRMPQLFFFFLEIPVTVWAIVIPWAAELDLSWAWIIACQQFCWETSWIFSHRNFWNTASHHWPFY